MKINPKQIVLDKKQKVIIIADDSDQFFELEGPVADLVRVIYEKKSCDRDQLVSELSNLWKISPEDFEEEMEETIEELRREQIIED